jgi:hypothetical protein
MNEDSSGISIQAAVSALKVGTTLENLNAARGKEEYSQV